ncbi:dihydroxyacetone kinase subunit DhaL [Vibrio sp. TH_r3]|uniref:dihydroxyacetone kinase subunit DhaL n=1 Tax=Vibrio sp. TH_r3 TaxID=3082084 RepID=UPI002953A0C2|nr:dihydroxyacetone kinase subunit DhaL [Vibrio sp. TH_r3]MDV7104978.1 dihydroxyacetone kinase subunit DhaL [Vibrio sp. TH_r3]
MVVTKEHIVAWLEDLAEVFQQNQDFLTQLDREIGDADHGLNMNRGFRKVIERLPTVADKDIGTILKTTGMTLLSSIGGASGPLYGTFFIRAASSVMAKEELTLKDVTVMLSDACEGVQKRGKAVIGDKTMIDAMVPMVESLEQSQSTSLQQALEHALQAAEKGMKDTIPLVAKKGRASYLGERSAGHQDPGATSTYLIVNSLVKAAF